MGQMVRVGIMGASGFAGGELCRLLLNHPKVSAITPYSRTTESFEIVHENLMGCGLQFRSASKLENDLDDLDVMFLCTPSGVAMGIMPILLKHQLRIIDLSADFRFDCAQRYQDIYGRSHSCPEILKNVVYGVSEFKRDQIRNTKIVANPGCYVITVLLALKPLFDGGWVSQDQPVIVSAINGTSGAGKTAKSALLNSAVHGGFLPYSLDGHRHGPELEDQIERLFGCQTTVHMTTAHGSFARGIFAQITLQANPEKLSQINRDILLKTCSTGFAAYSDDFSFVTLNDVQRKGKKNAKIYELYPNVARVLGSNRCNVGIDYDVERGLIKLVSVTDNLVKGAAGSAIQNMNIMFQYRECEGLRHYGL